MTASKINRDRPIIETPVTRSDQGLRPYPPLERPVNGASCRWGIWVFHLDPGFRLTRSVGRVEFLRHDAFQAKLTHGVKQSISVALGMFNVLDATTRAKQEFAQSCLAFGKRSALHVITIEHQQVESAGDREVIVDAAVQGIKISHPVLAGQITSASRIAEPLSLWASSTMSG